MRKKRVTPSKDPAVIALHRVMTSRSDAQYDAAIADLETCPALTAQGVRAKRNLERSRQAALEQGDRLTPEGRIMMGRLADTIDEGLALLTRAGLRTPRPRPVPTPGPAPTPRGEASAPRPKSAKPLD
ncbi:hypothetical protein ACVWY3_006868 [Bradyrhizobium sp. USDA 4486]